MITRRACVDDRGGVCLQGIEPMPISPLEFDQMIAKEIENNIAIVKAAGLKFN